MGYLSLQQCTAPTVYFPFLKSGMEKTLKTPQANMEGEKEVLFSSRQAKTDSV